MNLGWRNGGWAIWKRRRLLSRKPHRVHPQSTDALRALAAVAIDQGDYVLALDAEAKLDQLGERIPELNYNIGVLLQQVQSA